MKRQEFSQRTKLKAYDRAAGICECGCGLPLKGARSIEYDHRIPCELGGDNSLDNCVVMRWECHQAKTAGDDMPRIAKSRSQRAGHVGAKESRSPIPGGKRSGWKRKIGGKIVPRG